MFIMSLAIADLTVGVIVMPISAAYAITGRINVNFLHSLEDYFQLLLLFKKNKIPKYIFLVISPNTYIRSGKMNLFCFQIQNA